MAPIYEPKELAVRSHCKSGSITAHCQKVMHPAPARIPARSKRQAMDWSLVLVSQGIEAIIAESSEESGWSLVVAEHDYEHDVESIRQYQLDNLGCPCQ